MKKYIIVLLIVCIGIQNVHSISNQNKKRNIDDYLDNQLDLSFDEKPFDHAANANIKAELINNSTMPKNGSKAADLLRSKLGLLKSADSFEKALNDSDLAAHPTWKDAPLNSVKTVFQKKKSNKMNIQNTPVYELHAIRCCLDSGKKIPMTCNDGTYNEAKEVCRKVGARLCTVKEIQSCKTCGAGCGFDRMSVWTSTGDDTEIKYIYGTEPIKKFVRSLRHNTKVKYIDQIVNAHKKVKVDPTQKQVDKFHQDFLNKERKANIFPKRIGHMKGEKDEEKFLKARIIDSDKVNNVEIGEHGNN